MIIVKEKEPLKIGDLVDDLKCIDITYERLGKAQYITKKYSMQCTKCGRVKKMLSPVIRQRKGTKHKTCGKGLKTVNKKFYSHWQSMRTRTNNYNYVHANCYSERGINSNEFENFIDFYDAMYSSYLEKAKEIGEQNVSLDRIDPNGNYSKNNCRWVHKSEQQGNTRKNVTFKVIFPDGYSEICTNINKFARQHNLDISTIRDVMNPCRGTKQHKGFKFERL